MARRYFRFSFGEAVFVHGVFMLDMLIDGASVAALVCLRRSSLLHSFDSTCSRKMNPRSCLRKAKACNRDWLSCRLYRFSWTRHVAQSNRLRYLHSECALFQFKLFDARQQRLIAHRQAFGSA